MSQAGEEVQGGPVRQGMSSMTSRAGSSSAARWESTGPKSSPPERGAVQQLAELGAEPGAMSSTGASASGVGSGSEVPTRTLISSRLSTNPGTSVVFPTPASPPRRTMRPGPAFAHAIA